MCVCACEVIYSNVGLLEVILFLVGICKAIYSHVGLLGVICFLVGT